MIQSCDRQHVAQELEMARKRKDAYVKKFPLT
jgi:hypothetical protein